MPRIFPIPASRLRKVFEEAGFNCVRIEGDHYVYRADLRTRVFPEKDEWKNQ